MNILVKHGDDTRVAGFGLLCNKVVCLLSLRVTRALRSTGAGQPERSRRSRFQKTSLFWHGKTEISAHGGTSGRLRL